MAVFYQERNIIIGKLAKGTSYIFEIRLANNAGTGPAEEVEFEVTTPKSGDCNTTSIGEPQCIQMFNKYRWGLVTLQCG